MCSHVSLDRFCSTCLEYFAQQRQIHAIMFKRKFQMANESFIGSIMRWIFMQNRTIGVMDRTLARAEPRFGGKIPFAEIKVMR